MKERASVKVTGCEESTVKVRAFTQLNCTMVWTIASKEEARILRAFHRGAEI